MDKEYYSIGEIAEICNIPIRTLRYYDEIGLLVPEKGILNQAIVITLDIRYYKLILLINLRFRGIQLKRLNISLQIIPFL